MTRIHARKLSVGASSLVFENHGEPPTNLFPTKDQPFGYGFGGLPEALSNDAVLKAYLAAPLTLYLGTPYPISRYR